MALERNWEAPGSAGKELGGNWEALEGTRRLWKALGGTGGHWEALERNRKGTGKLWEGSRKNWEALEGSGGRRGLTLVPVGDVVAGLGEQEEGGQQQRLVALVAQ